MPIRRAQPVLIGAAAMLRDRRALSPRGPKRSGGAGAAGLTTIGDRATRAPLHYAWHGASREAPPPPLRDGQRGRNSANPVCTAYCATASQALPLSAVGEGKLLKRREKAGNMEAERLKLLAVD